MARTKCQHNRHPSICVDCAKLGVRCAGICKHFKRRTHCYDCKGSAICSHGKRRQYCKLCGGVSLCKHGHDKHNCVPCKGTGTCEHGRIRNSCNICNPLYNFTANVRTRTLQSLGSSRGYMEYLGCSTQELVEHLQRQFQPEMSLENYGEWEMDHIKPLCPTRTPREEVIQRLHYTNIQPLWMHDNRIKSANELGTSL